MKHDEGMKPCSLPGERITPLLEMKNLIPSAIALSTSIHMTTLADFLIPEMTHSDSGSADAI